MRLLPLLLLLAGCIGARVLDTNPGPGETVRVRGWAQRATGWDVWVSHDKVPARWLHLVDWHTGPYPVFVVIAGQMACAVDGATFVMAQPGQYVTCTWMYPR